MADDVKAQRDDEVFDVVDEQDRVVGQATRAEVHAQRLRHRAVHAWVFNAAGRVFLQKRSRLKDMAPGCWDSSCSGHLDAGEDYDAAMVRELSEEIGLWVESVPERLLRETACAATGREFVWVYRLEAEGPFVLHPAEIETGAWYEPVELDTRLREQPVDFAPAFAHLWRKWREREGH
jgi:isopentenyl-diphosphate delta-isomerase type 1